MYYYHKLTEQQFGAAQCLAAGRPIAVLSKIFYKLPIILKYCSSLLDTYKASVSCKRVSGHPPICYFGGRLFWPLLSLFGTAHAQFNYQD